MTMAFMVNIVHCETKGTVARRTMNRPDARNCLLVTMLDRLNSAICASGTVSRAQSFVTAAGCHWRLLLNIMERDVGESIRVHGEKSQPNRRLISFDMCG